MLIDWITVILLILIGLTLIIVELIFVPGTTIIGILGFILTAIGIWIGYAALGSNTGHVILAAAVLVGGIAFFYSFRSDVWTRFALKERNESHVNEEFAQTFEIGEIGRTVSALRPQGTAIFRDSQQEVQTNGEYLEPNTQVRIIRLSQNKIIVEKIS
ncbi:NfeD family protein [Pontibacter vulgaris]|uniref:NfeD family protein n=1 Tax=Pontibacter vulgaris TaxID=2905679 RepID=UPI001FA6CE27|nr:NfeD family protein [Pontibacter vulgaris]